MFLQLLYDAVRWPQKELGTQMQNDNVYDGVGNQHFVCTQEAGEIDHHTGHVYGVSYSLIDQRDKLEQSFACLFGEGGYFKSFLYTYISCSHTAATARSEARHPRARRRLEE